LEWAEIASQYFFLPSPAIASFVGQPIMDRTRRTGHPILCDEFGDNLHGITLPYDGYRRQHDASKTAIFDLATLAGISVDKEILNLFKSVIPPDKHAAFVSAHQDGKKRTGQGIVPDLKLRLTNDHGGSRDFLCEIKTLHMGSSTYSIRGSGPRSVDIRASSINPDLEKALRKADLKYCDTALNGPPGPMLTRWHSFGPTKALVFGCLGEMSQDAHILCRDISVAAGLEFLRSQNSANRSIAFGNGTWYTKRVLAMVCLRARANLLLDRLQFLGPGAKGAYERSKAAKQKQFSYSSSYEFACRIENMRREDRDAHRHNAGHSDGRWGRN